jgi:hypothetical protein
MISALKPAAIQPLTGQPVLSPSLIGNLTEPLCFLDTAHVTCTTFYETRGSTEYRYVIRNTQ